MAVLQWVVDNGFASSDTHSAMGQALTEAGDIEGAEIAFAQAKELELFPEANSAMSGRSQLAHDTRGTVGQAAVDSAENASDREKL